MNSSLRVNIEIYSYDCQIYLLYLHHYQIYLFITYLFISYIFSFEMVQVLRACVRKIDLDVVISLLFLLNDYKLRVVIQLYHEFLW